MILPNELAQHAKILVQMKPSGGKTRVWSSLALHYMKTTNKLIFVVFPNKGLLKRDEKETEDLWQYAEIVDPKARSRLQFVVGVDEIKERKQCIVIVDESDVSCSVILLSSTRRSKTQVLLCLPHCNSS